MSSYWIKSVLRESFVFFAYFYRRLFRSCGSIKGCRLDSASFFGKILPLAVWRFSRKPLWLELSIPICGFTFATGTYLTGVLKYLRRFAVGLQSSGLPTSLAKPKRQTTVLDAKECVFKKRLAARREVDIVQWTEKSRDGKPVKQVCIRRDGQMFIICLALPMHSCGDCHQHTTLCISPVVPATMRKIQNVGCLKAFLYMPASVLTADSRHWGRPKGVAKGEVSVLSSRHSVAIALYPARPDSVIQQQRTAQRRAVSREESWGSISNQV